MAESSWPFEDIDVSETQFSLWANAISGGSGVLPSGGNLEVTGDNSGMQVRVAAGRALVRGHFYDNSIQATLAITSAGTNTRKDAVVLELDAANNGIVLKVVQGTAVASNPVAPTLTQTEAGIYQLLLGYVTIPASASSILSTDVADARVYYQGWATTSGSPFLLMGA